MIRALQVIRTMLRHYTHTTKSRTHASLPAMPTSQRTNESANFFLVHLRELHSQKIRRERMLLFPHTFTNDSSFGDSLLLFAARTTNIAEITFMQRCERMKVRSYCIIRRYEGTKLPWYEGILNFIRVSHFFHTITQ